MKNGNEQKVNYKQIKRQFKHNQIKSTLRLLNLSRVVLYLIMMLEKVDDIVMRLVCVFLGFQYDIYTQLYKVSYNSHYLEQAEKIKYQIEITLPLIGE